MKRILSFILIVTALCTLTVPCFAANPSVAVKTVNAATVGETITVSVNLSENSGLGGIKFSVNFNSSEFQLVKNSAQVSGLFSAIPVEKSSSVEYTGASVNTVNSSGAILTFKLKVLKTGGKITINIIEAINGDNENVKVSATGATVKCSHANAKWVVTKNATCTEKGSEIRECSCGDKATREINLAKHNFGAWKITKEATEIEVGAKERICKVCNHKETAEIAKIVPTQTETETKTETETQSETQTETTTTQQNQNNAKPVIVGSILFVVGVAVGIGVTMFIIKCKSKEE